MSVGNLTIRTEGRGPNRTENRENGNSKLFSKNIEMRKKIAKGCEAFLRGEAVGEGVE
jgi:hypothetical protein